MKCQKTKRRNRMIRLAGRRNEIHMDEENFFQEYYQREGQRYLMIEMLVILFGVALLGLKQLSAVWALMALLLAPNKQKTKKNNKYTNINNTIFTCHQAIWATGSISKHFLWSTRMNLNDGNILHLIVIHESVDNPLLPHSESPTEEEIPTETLKTYF